MDPALYGSDNEPRSPGGYAQVRDIISSFSILFVLFLHLPEFNSASLFF